MKLWILGLVLGLLSTVGTAANVDFGEMQADVLIKADDFSITLFDLYMYLEPEPAGETGSLDWGSENRVREGLQQLYALNTLKLEALNSQVMEPAEREWVADYELTMRLVSMHLEQQVEAEAAKINWEAVALEYYLAHQNEFLTPEALTLQTLLIREDACNPGVASETVSLILSEINAGLEFEAAVTEYTEDEAARSNKGMMAMVVRGQTVPEFEEAAFALASPGEISGPVETEFGAHLIKLIDRKPSMQRPFEEVKPKIIASLEAKKKGEILETLRWEAREKRPSGLMLDETRLKQLIADTQND